MLLIAGGAADPQLSHMINRARARGVPLTTLLHGEQADLPLLWDVETGRLYAGAVELRLNSAFVRQDVFRYLRTGNAVLQADARNWKVMLDGWLWSTVDVRIFNRRFAMKDAVNKPLALLWAREFGLAIPRTIIGASKTEAMLALETTDIVYKPVAGGDLCRALDRESLDRVRTPHLPRPYIFQEQLVQPELRVFRIGERFMSFQVKSDALDYRESETPTEIVPVTTPAHLVGPLRKLTDRLGLTYAAADFKTSAQSNALVFLEVNSNPMFAAFDKVSGGALVDAMLDWLTGEV